MKTAPLILCAALALCLGAQAAPAQVSIISTDDAPAKAPKKPAAKKKSAWRKGKAKANLTETQDRKSDGTVPDTLSQSSSSETIPTVSKYQRVKAWDDIVNKAWAESGRGYNDRALRMVSSITAQGYPPAIAVTGAFYYAINDYENALRYTKSAANKGNAPAMLTMADFCFKGLGTEQARDCEAGVWWLKQAAGLGHVPAMMRLAKTAEKGSCGADIDLSEAFEWYMKAAKRGSALAQYRVGMAYRQGVGVDFDSDEAVAWLKKSAAKKYGPALAALGYFYKEGLGVERDYDKALEYFQAGDLNGDPQALAALADMYLNGLSVEQDIPKGLEMMRNAGSKGYRGAYQRLAEIYFNAGDYPNALRAYKDCSLLGGVACQSRLCYINWAGDHIPQSTSEAYVWCGTAGYFGSSESANYFAQLKNYNFLSPDALRAAKASMNEIIRRSLEYYKTHAPETADEAQLQKEALAQEKARKEAEDEQAPEEAAEPPQEEAPQEQEQE